MPKYLTVDPLNMFDTRVGKPGGLKRQQLHALEPRAKKAYTKLERDRTKETQGFRDLPFDTKTINLIEKTATGVQRKFKTMIVVGIGGSDLGARAIYSALGSDYKGVKLLFAGNPDPEKVAKIIDRVDWKSTAINIVSKSGSTLETMSVFFILRDKLIRSVGKNQAKTHIFATTDIRGGILQGIAEQEGYTILPHPLNVGGRFAVLSTVGLFPAACAGVPIRMLLAGARSIENEHRTKKHKSDAARYGALQYLAYTKHDQRIQIMMPYAEALTDFAFWYRQIWAESLGKQKGERHLGPTPIASVGTIDQHSQIQLYNEGPKDKTITFIIPKKYRAELSVPKSFTNIEKIKYFQGLSLEKIIHAEHFGTAKALAANGVPNMTLQIDKIRPETLGALFMFIELATAYFGEFLAINTYNQPGVEFGKAKAKLILAKK